jgi:hypothetical protein
MQPFNSAGGGDSYASPAVEAIEPDPFNGFENYYAFDVKEKWYFPDGKQWIEYRKMTEGDRAKYLKATRSDVHLNQKSGEARIPFDQSNDRMELLLASITNWYLVSWVTGRPEFVPFQSGSSKGGVVAQWIQRADPQVLGQLEKAIRKCNPWLLNEMSVEQIDKEIADLQELRIAAEKREAEEGNSAFK